MIKKINKKINYDFILYLLHMTHIIIALDYG
jgi:hypothetical protein